MADTERPGGQPENADNIPSGGGVEEGGEKGGEGEGQSSQEPNLDPAKFTPQVRTRPWSNRQERAKHFQNQSKKSDDGISTEEESSPKDEAPDPRYMTREEFEKTMSPALAAQADAQEIAAFLLTPSNAHLTKYAPLATKYAAVHPTVPIADVFKILSYDEAIRLGAEKAMKVEDKSKRQPVGGSAKRESKSALPDFKSMNPAQLSEFNNRVRMGERFEAGS